MQKCFKQKFLLKVLHDLLTVQNDFEGILISSIVILNFEQHSVHR